MSIKALQDYTYYAKYARYNEKEKRRETWAEAIDRVIEMHLRRYPQMKEEIEWIRPLMKEKRFLGSQRALQYGGEPIEKKHARLYNCTSSQCDRIRFFQEAFWLLLCGCGVGFSVQKHHICTLPNFSSNNRTNKKIYVIPDSIEGWSDSLGVLLATYFDFPEFSEYNNSYVEFDFSSIRPKGSLLSSGIGKAPGAEPLKHALEKIRNVLDKCIADGLTRLRTIDAYDIVMHASDAVLSGGLRRAATICIFSPSDNDMLKAKTGNWFYENPQRGRSNNSALLLRDETTKEQFDSIIENIKQFGEPAFIFADNRDNLFNPCVTEDTIIATDNGLRTVKDLIGKPFNALVNGKSYECKTGFFSTGHKAVLKLTFESGRELKITPNHQILTSSGWKEANDIIPEDNIVIHSHGKHYKRLWIEEFYEASDKSESIINTNSILSQDDICKNYGYLLGLIGKINLNNLPKSTESLRNIQIALNYFGIYSSIKNNELVLSQENLNKLNSLNIDFNAFQINDKLSDKLVSKEEIGTHDVYDCTVEDIHAFDANGVYVHNCVEVGLYGYDEHGNSGFHFCNLNEINGRKIKTIEDFRIAAKGAAILGTLQAGYTDFPYLGPISESIVRREALLGVSITGMMDSPEILFNPEIQREMAELIKATNKEIAAKIGINPSARTTCIKPSGASSCILGTASGIHPHHAKRYFRRVQANQLEPILQYFKRVNPLAIEKSVWSANNTDDIVTFCVEVPPGAKTKNDLSAVELLEYVRLTQQNWVTYGRDVDLCVQPWLNHNVSNTINVRADEWDTVAKYIYDNRKDFAGVSLLPSSGDLDYPQAPMVNILTHKEIIHEYGEGALFASGLIVDGLHVFDNLWEACDVVLGRNSLVGPEENTKEYIIYYNKQDWIRRVKQFAERYCEGDLMKCTRLLKHVHNWKMWVDLKREYKDVDYLTLIEETNNVKLNETVACAGGTCELHF